MNAGGVGAAVATKGKLMQAPPVLEQQLSNTIGMRLAFLPPGSFWMGSPESEPDCYGNEWPLHAIGITRPFYIGIYPVTQYEFEAVVGSNPSFFHAGRGGGLYHPVEQVSWTDAAKFCARLSALPAEKEVGRLYRLPTEAEWEYACRAGTQTPFAFGASLASAEANFNGLYPYGTAPRGPYLRQTSRVGSYSANAFGLFDMHGQVWEWCADFYDDDYYQVSPTYDPPGPVAGIRRSVRGGAWSYAARGCRSAVRYGYGPGVRNSRFGFRVVCSVAE
jgi:formylglycine-generating enzyme required for sulfatase activity